MTAFTLGFQDIDKNQIALAGGKGANLGELFRIEGIRVPDGFCVTTAAFKSVIENIPDIQAWLAQAEKLSPDDREGIATHAGAIRGLIENAPVPAGLFDAINYELDRFGDHQAWAVRSSATAEDLPGASFAGQQDTYLNVIGSAAIMQAVTRCWASLYTDRAVAYRLQNGFAQQQVSLSVVIQKMIFPEAAGVLFTADPISAHRKISSIEAAFGLGEALVSGLVNTDVYQVKNGNIFEKKVAGKHFALIAAPEGGIVKVNIEPEKESTQVLQDAQILELERIGRKIEQHFGSPQDIEWCLADGQFHIVQSRPITTLFPIPTATDDAGHIYVSVGHQQMMTDAMKPLGLSVWQRTAGRPMVEAGGRLFVDVAPDLASAERRNLIVDVLGKSDPLIKDALRTLLDRGDLIPETTAQPAGSYKGPAPADYQTLRQFDKSVVPALIAQDAQSIETLKKEINGMSGTALIDFISNDIVELRKSLTDPKSFGVIMTAMNAAAWINANVEAWLGEKNAADAISQSLDHNVTSAMGLALLDVADAIRPYPEVIAHLEKMGDEDLEIQLASLPGGREAWKSIQVFLEKYGMRCAGEIDLTNPRWSEDPKALIPVILNNIKTFRPGERVRKFEEGKQVAAQKTHELLSRLSALPEGARKADETKQMIALVRDLAGYREYPKFGIVSRYFIYKQALLKEALRLEHSGIIRERDDIFYLTFEELRQLFVTNKMEQALMRERKEAFYHYKKLKPPRVITSDGEILNGSYHHDKLPANAIAGLPVSSGVVEGRARVIHNMQDADLEEGDILVTPFTDPSWTPLFVSIRGLVTEVGGLMTHGAVIAREYGLPAIVGVTNATKLISNGQKIRVNGSDGFVEILE